MDREKLQELMSGTTQLMRAVEYLGENMSKALDPNMHPHNPDVGHSKN